MVNEVPHAHEQGTSRGGLLLTIDEQQLKIVELQEGYPEVPKSKSVSSSDSPSTLGKEEMFIKTYQDYHIYCNIPPGSWKTHPGLYFAPFSEFRELKVPDEDFILLAKKAADFVYRMTKSYNCEDSSLTALFFIFQEVFTEFSLFPNAGKGYRTDISFHARKRKLDGKELLLGNVELKHGLGQGNTNPNLQNIHYYRKLCSKDNGINPFLLLSTFGAYNRIRLYFMLIVIPSTIHAV